MEIIGQPTPLQEWMETVHRQHGRLTPEIVREAARPVDSPAHGWVFNLEPGAAAEEHYLARAHDLIQRVKVRVLTQAETEPRVVRFWHAVPGGEETRYTYEPITQVVQQRDKLDLVLREAMRRLAETERSVADLHALTKDAEPRARTRRALDSVRDAREALTAAE